MLKAILLGVSAIGSIAAVNKSRASRVHRQYAQGETIETGATPVQAHGWSPSRSPPKPLVIPSTTTSTTTNLTIAYILLLQTLVSMLLVTYSTSFQPRQIQDALTWMQLVAGVCIAALGAHAATYYFLNLQKSAPQYIIEQVRAFSNSFSGSQQRAAVSIDASVTNGPPSIPADIAVLEGTWFKDKDLSDSMDAACDLIELHGVVRLAVSLVKGLQIQVQPEDQVFKMSVLSGVLWFKITERYPLNGEIRRHRRRDLRGGGSLGRIQQATNGGVIMNNKFTEPLAGSVQERFYCTTENLLHVDTVMTVRGRSVNYRQVYRRRLHNE